MALFTRTPAVDETKPEAAATPKARELALQDELWLSRTIQLARMRKQPAGALCVANGRLIAEAVGPSGGMRAPDNIVLTHIASSRPRRTTLYASLVSLDAHRALRMRAVSLTRIVLHLVHPIAPEVEALLRARGAQVRVVYAGASEWGVP
jgi:hypothetical protein